MLHWRRPGSLLASDGCLLARTGLTPFCLHSSLLRYGLIGKSTFFIVLLSRMVGREGENAQPAPAQLGSGAPSVGVVCKKGLGGPGVVNPDGLAVAPREKRPLSAEPFTESYPASCIAPAPTG